MRAASDPARSRLTVVYDGDCGMCSVLAAWVHARDRRGRLAFATGAHDALRAERDGVTHSGARAVNAIAATLVPPVAPLLRAVERSRPLLRAEEAAYDFVARNRGGISRLLGLSSCRWSA